MTKATKTATEIAYNDQKRYELLRYLSEVREHLYNQMDLANRLQPLFSEDITQEDKMRLEMKLKNDVEKMMHALWLLDGALTKAFHLIRSGVSLEKAIGDFAISMIDNPVSEIPKNFQLKFRDEGPSEDAKKNEENQETNVSSTSVPQFEESTPSFNELLKSFENEGELLKKRLDDLNHIDMDQVNEYWKSRSSSPIKAAMSLIGEVLEREKNRDQRPRIQNMSREKERGASGNILYPSVKEDQEKTVSDHLRLPRVTDILHKNQFYVEIQLDEPQPIDSSQIEEFIKVDQVPPQLVERIDYDFVSMNGELVVRMLSMDDFGQRSMDVLKNILDHKEGVRRINIHHLDATGQNEIGVTTLNNVTLNRATSGFDHADGDVSRVNIGFSFQKFDIQSNNKSRRKSWDS